ncbi:MAG: penicillin-binding transpeptidase domain-containing protein [Saprospiraceae bacterium]
MANRGYFYTPHLVKGIKISIDIDTAYTSKHQIDINKEYFEYIVEGMERVVTSGTAAGAYISDISICGKTGTAQNPHLEDHSVFFGFAPRDNPKIAIAVYVENAGWGSSYAAPIASLMIEKYLREDGKISPYRQYLEDRMVQLELLP